MLSETARVTEDLHRIATLLPDLLSQSLESIKRGELRVQFDLQGFERLVRDLTRASNSLAVGIVISGLFVSSSLIYRIGHSTLAYVGLGMALVLGLWLLWNMSRE
jgi:ubiquinone biosynthesis protein